MTKRRKGLWPTKLKVVTIRLFEEDVKACKKEAEATGVAWQTVARLKFHRALKGQGFVS